MKKEKLIVFEGISGTGKETQAKLLRDYLSKQKITTQIVYHPTPEMKTILSTWRKLRNIDRLTEVYLLMADRSDRVRQIIQPTLKRGDWVISLRSYLSALVYQGESEKDRDWISDEFAHFEPTPDYLFYFDIDPVHALARIKKRHQETGEALGSFEKRGLLEEKLAAYKKVLQMIPHITIDANLSIETIHSEIISHLGVDLT